MRSIRLFAAAALLVSGFAYAQSAATAASAPSIVQTRLGPTVRIDHPKHAPKALKRVNPHYPEAARAAGTTGLVKMDVLIDTRGHVVDVKVLTGAPNGLTEAAVTAARQWKYKPLVRDGKAWPVLFPVVMSFKL